MLNIKQNLNLDSQLSTNSQKGSYLIDSISNPLYNAAIRRGNDPVIPPGKQASSVTYTGVETSWNPDGSVHQTWWSATFDDGGCFMSGWTYDC